MQMEKRPHVFLPNGFDQESKKNFDQNRSQDGDQ
jgi:hypothetical protein